jgi:hypothetical protein
LLDASSQEDQYWCRRLAMSLNAITRTRIFTCSLPIRFHDRCFIGYVLPGITFPTLTVLGAKYIFAHFLNPSLTGALKTQCEPGQPFSGFYTGITPLDGLLCSLVAFFVAALQPLGESLTTSLVVQLLPLALFTFYEGARTGRAWLFSGTGAAILGLGYQRFTGGVILPLYWLALIVTGAHKRAGRVSQRNADGLAFAAIVAYAVPSVMMVGTHNAGWTALWQGFPVLIWIAHWIHFLIVPTALSANAYSGAGTVQKTYIACAIIAAITHLITVLPNLSDLDVLKHVFIPRVVTVDEVLSMQAGTLNFLQWDAIFISGAAALASLWFGRNTVEVVGLAIWNVVAGAIIGPGAALALVYAWRESWIDA